MLTSQYLEILGYVLTGGLITTVVNNLWELVMWICGRKATLHDREDQQLHDLSETVVQIDKLEQKLIESDETLHGVAEGMRLILYDRIKFIGTSFIRKKRIGFDERTLLIRMTSLYSDTLHGENAVDLELLMEEIKRLPLKDQNESGPTSY